MDKETKNMAVLRLIQTEYGQNQLFTQQELLKHLAKESIEVAERTLRRWLSVWVENKQLVKTGQKRGTRYQLVSTSSNQKLEFLKGIEPAKRVALLAKLRDLWTHNSTALEGNTLSLGDTNTILELGLTISGKPLREHHEIMGHAKAIDIIYSICSKKLTKKHLFELHKAVQKEVIMDIYQPVGDWKVEKNYSNSINSQGEPVTIEYAEPKHINKLMTKLIETFNQWDNSSISQSNAHESYAKLHLAFVHIHPFADGNGRLARLVSNLPLLKAGLPPLLIDQKRRREYITLLADYQSQLPTPTIELVEDKDFWVQPELLEPFSKFCAKCYEMTVNFE